MIRVGALIGAIELLGDADGVIIYNLTSTRVFHLVRGDVAVLRPGQEKSASRWYIRRWEDLSASFGFAPRGPSTNSTTSSSWGSIKNQYR